MAASGSLLGEPPAQIGGPPPSPSRSPTFTMARARKFIGRLSKRKRPARNDTTGQQKESKNNAAKPTESGGSDVEVQSLDGKENTPPTTEGPHGGAAVGLSPARFKPWPRQSTRWRLLTQTERETVKRMLRIASDADRGRGQTEDLEKIVFNMLGQLHQDVDVTGIVSSCILQGQSIMFPLFPLSLPL